MSRTSSTRVTLSTWLNRPINRPEGTKRSRGVPPVELSRRGDCGQAFKSGSTRSERGCQPYSKMRTAAEPEPTTIIRETEVPDPTERHPLPSAEGSGSPSSGALVEIAELQRLRDEVGLERISTTSPVSGCQGAGPCSTRVPSSRSRNSSALRSARYKRPTQARRGVGGGYEPPVRRCGLDPQSHLSRQPNRRGHRLCGHGRCAGQDDRPS